VKSGPGLRHGRLGQLGFAKLKNQRTRAGLRHAKEGAKNEQKKRDRSNFYFYPHHHVLPVSEKLR
jgi:hypothetical protein